VTCSTEVEAGGLTPKPGVLNRWEISPMQWEILSDLVQ